MRHHLPPADGLTLDTFQLEAIEAIDRDRSVLVAAPTSSGKTLVAFYGIAAALAEHTTVAYTAPTKALSNQKLRELTAWLGDDVGLLTGDSVIRPDAKVVVMTTEVLRNMVYARSSFLDRLGTVVLDEVHFLQDAYRGPVWEEVIISLPRRVKLVCLSATVANAAELAGWIKTVRGTCEVIVERNRPVALSDHYLVFDVSEQQMRSFPTLAEGRANVEVERYLERAGGSGAAAQRQGRRARGGPGRGGPGRGGSGRGGRRAVRPKRAEVLAHLAAAEHLPAIIFVFSRLGCDEAVGEFMASGMTFLDPLEAGRVREIAEAHTEHLSEEDLVTLDYDRWVAGLEVGVAAHHAGMVPPFKEAVEECFGAGLIHAVFATETLAVGVNMPARAVVIEQLTRFGGEGFVMLTPAQYTQLTGRAGRRGLDAQGHAYTLWSPHTSFAETARLVASTDYELESAFTPTYNMAANLIATRSREDAVALLRQSFAQYRADARLARAAQPAASQKSSRAEVGLVKALDARVAVLSQLGLADDWRLTASGDTLRNIFFECDLLAALALHAGVFDGLRPSELAAVASCLTYEHRSRLPATPPQIRSSKLAERVAQLEALNAELVEAELAAGVPLSSEPDNSLFEVALRWAKGKPMGASLGDDDRPSERDQFGVAGRDRRRRYGNRNGAVSIGELLSPGDFVRQMRQLADLLRQLGKAAPDAETQHAAAAGSRSVLRGVVAESVGMNTAGTTEPRSTEPRSTSLRETNAEPTGPVTRRIRTL